MSFEQILNTIIVLSTWLKFSFSWESQSLSHSILFYPIKKKKVCHACQLVTLLTMQSQATPFFSFHRCGTAELKSFGWVRVFFLCGLGSTRLRTLTEKSEWEGIQVGRCCSLDHSLGVHQKRQTWCGQPPEASEISEHCGEVNFLLTFFPST